MTGPLFELGGTEGRTSAASDEGFPAWLQRRLEAAGLMDPDTGATRKARVRRCEQCRRPVWRGIDEDFAGRSADADVRPLSAVGEVLACMAGRTTFELSYLGGRFELTRRNRWRITGRPVGTKRMDVVAGHICGNGAQFDYAITAIQDKSSPVIVPADAPF